MLLSLAWLGAVAAHVIALSPVDSGSQASLPSSFSWTSSGPIIGPRDDGHGVRAIKDPSIVYYQGRYHVFASAPTSSNFNLVYLSFTDFASAKNAKFHYLERTRIGRGYRAAPEVLYHRPHKLWYLVYQSAGPTFSTNADIGDPSGWSAPRSFYAGTPATVRSNKGNGSWLDFWVICDGEYCYLFSCDDNGHLYCAKTSISDFPSGMSEPVIVLRDEKMALFEACNVYNVGGSYLLIVEAVGRDGNRYFRSWTAETLSSPWKRLADTEANPFARHSNVQYPTKPPWSLSVSHGEVVRSRVDETLSIDPCGMQYLYQGLPHSKDFGNYNTLPWQLGLLNQTNC
ncbi:uncharacterized protein UV8b_03436 [Ustilaginoidea virens]|uniref:Alpha-L-arabinofuranosidase n=1 Tax=Ustilaginoidea virens TaxID=1159556 RepID=A0A063BS94_USTVR|nr:uncharacterized protein UV8b_03436 [Ustilaginoidea virens]QUC19195.1 hypothetical protein UV8b_03436 [Ustilaginoidea virens]GAO19692.1 hypothetical protein UVI_02061530 [Ustilaginoidea virens]